MDDRDKTWENCLWAEGLECMICKKLTERASERREREKGHNRGSPGVKWQPWKALKSPWLWPLYRSQSFLCPEGPRNREKNTQPETGAQTLLFLSLWGTLVLWTDRCLSAVIWEGRRWKGIMCVTQRREKRRKKSGCGEAARNAGRKTARFSLLELKWIFKTNSDFIDGETEAHEGSSPI